LRKAGKSICVIGRKEQEALRVGKKIETTAHGDERLIHHSRDAHLKEGNQPHFQTRGVRGHTWYKVVSSVALTTYFGDNIFAEIGDFFNPLSIGKDLADIYDEIFNDETEGQECGCP
jgi:hypothetical protein